jgi:tetratricopeptide (TPR) repeat protein
MPSRNAKRSVSVALETTANTHTWVRRLLVTLSALLLLSLFSGEIRDTDIWLHLKTGQHTIETRALTVPDPFSYTSDLGPRYAGEEITRFFNLTHEWLAQIVMYQIYRGAGFPGLVAGRAAMLIAFCGLVGWMSFRRSGDFYISLAAALAAAGVAFHFQQSRPFLATFVCLAVTMAILEARRRLWVLPPLFLVWANLHAGFFTGWLLLGTYCGEALIYRVRGKEGWNDRQLWLAALASFVASGLNPNGFRVIRVLLLYRSSPIQMDNLEWQRPMFWEPGIYSFLLFGSLVVLILFRGRTRPVDWLLFLGFAGMSLMAVRNVIFLALVAPVVMAAYLPKPRAVPQAAAIAAAAGLLLYDVAPAWASGNTFAFRAAEWQLPSGAADFIRAHQLKHRMFNNYENGGYLAWRLWPIQRDFIDPRGLSEEAYADYRHMLLNTDAAGKKGAEKLLAKYGIRMIVVDGFDYLSGQAYPLVMELAGSSQPDWKLVYADAKGVILMRQPPPDVQPLETGTALMPSLEAQCELHIRHDRGRPHCARGLAELYSVLGDGTRARQWIAFYLAHRTGPDPEAERIDRSLEVTSLNDSALSLESSGDLAGAEGLLRRALAIAEGALGPDHPDTAGTLNNLASLLEGKGDLTGAEALYRRALRICESRLGPDDPRTARSLDNLAGLLGARGDYAAAAPLYRRALAIAEKAFGPDDAATREIRENLQNLVKKSPKGF